MTNLSVQPYEIPAAQLGPENPLPAFRAPNPDLSVITAQNVPEEDKEYLGWQTAFRVLPYRMQDSYSREKHPRAFRSVVLENEFLKAVFLPELGGRLVSLSHKPEARELLDRNPVFQSANLALRNAWFSGGIEWNAGHFGHHYLTCSPVFAARITGTAGEPALRLFEWDRVKCFPWQIDFHLPPGSQFLFAKIRLVNPHNEEIPMYWWTNMGVEETPDTRVLVPTDKAIHGSTEGFKVVDFPDGDGGDVSYPAHARKSQEYFFRLPPNERKWIAALRCDGAGLVQVSTNRLLGRKLFLWGTSQGGRRWKEFLAQPGSSYFEIQAGLARTQIESIPMPARAEWTWTEAFGLMHADASATHSDDWGQARHATALALDAMLPVNRMDELDRSFAAIMTQPTGEILARASGWGALERRRLKIQEQPDNIPSELSFPEDTLGNDQIHWISLLTEGALPERKPEDDPGQYMIQPEWCKLLEESICSGRGNHWLAWLHLGIMRLEAFDTKGARAAWEESLKLKASGWALRNLAMLDIQAENLDAACAYLKQAWEIGPKLPQLAVEYAQVLVKTESYDDLAAFTRELPPDIRANERIRLLLAQAALHQGYLDGIEDLFEHDFATVREGEVSLTDLWFAFHEKRISAVEGAPVDDALRDRVRILFPPPSKIDFRMTEDEG